MKKILYISIAFLVTFQVMAQKPQRIAYIDMVYILNQVQDYQEAKSSLDMKMRQWQTNLESLNTEISSMESALTAERALLTQDLINEKEEDIAIKRQEYQDLQNQYFGMEGDLFQLRQQLVKPIQDQVFNAVQDIASKRGYDFVLDKSSDLIMLYSNDKYDISDQVVNAITRSGKADALRAKQKAIKDRNNKKNVVENKNGKEIANDTNVVEEIDEENIDNVPEEEVVDPKRQEMLDRIEANKAERQKKAEERRLAIEKARQERIAKQEAAKAKMQARRDSIINARKGK